MSTSAAASTNRRFRRLLVTINLNIGFSTDLINEFRPVNHDSLAFCQAGGDDQAGGVERLCAHGSRLEPLGLDVQPYDGFAVAAAHHSLPGNDHAGNRGAGLGNNSDGLANAEIRWSVRNGELNERGMVLQGAAEATKCERHALSAGP